MNDADLFGWHQNNQYLQKHTLPLYSVLQNLPVQIKLHSDLLMHCTCLKEFCGTACILFYFVKTQLSVPALETIQLINSLMEVSCLLLSPFTWSLPPVFSEKTFPSPPNPHSHRPFSSPLFSRIGKFFQKEARM